MEQLLGELFREATNEYGLPPGFRFHPTDEELVTFYLFSKVFNGGFSGLKIVEVDLNKCEPWELPDIAKMGEREWYFYSLRDRKYPTGLRANRATGSGYWKATGKDRVVSYASTGALVGMKKTLVFYRGRAPRAEKTKWVLHEYRLEGHLCCRHTSHQEEWVICRVFHKGKCLGEKNQDPIHQSHGAFMEPPPASSNNNPLFWTLQHSIPSINGEALLIRTHTFNNYEPEPRSNAPPTEGTQWLAQPQHHPPPDECSEAERGAGGPPIRQLYCEGMVPILPPPPPPPELQEDAAMQYRNDMIEHASPFVFDVGLLNQSNFFTVGSLPDAMPFGSEPSLL